MRTFFFSKYMLEKICYLKFSFLKDKVGCVNLKTFFQSWILLQLTWSVSFLKVILFFYKWMLAGTIDRQFYQQEERDDESLLQDCLPIYGTVTHR